MKAEEEFKLAWGGQVWEKGFTFWIITSATSSQPAATWPYTLRDNVASLNPKFHINVGEMSWYNFLQALLARELPLFLMGWLADYPDAHSLVQPFMYSEDFFPHFQSYSDAAVDALINAGISTMDTTARHAIYYQLQAIYHNQCASVPTAQPLLRHWERDWVQGWYYNSAYPGLYFYHMWKGLNGDVNGDGKVDLFDAAAVSAHWYPGPPIGPLDYNRKADINPILAPDGKVNILDAAIVSAHWGETTS
jgi:peptide/nickel transport system substrate-binding protein